MSKRRRKFTPEFQDEAPHSTTRPEPSRSPAICHRKPTGAATVLSFPSGRVEFSADCSRTRSSGRALSRGSRYAQDRGGRLVDGAIAGRPDHNGGTGLAVPLGAAAETQPDTATADSPATAQAEPTEAAPEPSPVQDTSVGSEPDPASAAGDPAAALPADPAAAAAQQAREQAAAQQKAQDEATKRQAKPKRSPRNGPLRPRGLPNGRRRPGPGTADRTR